MQGDINVTSHTATTKCMDTTANVIELSEMVCSPVDSDRGVPSCGLFFVLIKGFHLPSRLVNITYFVQPHFQDHIFTGAILLRDMSRFELERLPQHRVRDSGIFRAVALFGQTATLGPKVSLGT